MSGTTMIRGRTMTTGKHTGSNRERTTMIHSRRLNHHSNTHGSITTRRKGSSSSNNNILECPMVTINHQNPLGKIMDISSNSSSNKVGTIWIIPRTETSRPCRSNGLHISRDSINNNKIIHTRINRCRREVSSSSNSNNITSNIRSISISSSNINALSIPHLPICQDTETLWEDIPRTG